MTADLKGPFSPFTIALHNIRANLLAKEGEIKKQDILQEYLREIITLAICVPKNKDIFLEFPAAGYWEHSPAQQESKFEFIYSGKFSTDNDFETMPEANFVEDNLSRKFVELRERGVEKGGLEDFPDKALLTNFPESLRKVKGFWLMKGIPNVTLLVFYTYIPGDQEPEISPENLEIILKSFKNLFLRKGWQSLKQLLARDTTARDITTKSSAPILEDILSLIQEEIRKLKERKQDSTEKRLKELQRIFSVVFVRPSLNKKRELRFRYVLTNEQISYLTNIKAEVLEFLIKDAERDSFWKLFEHANRFMAHPPAKISNEKELEKAINQIIQTDEWQANGEVEELLRQMIYTFYAFQNESIKEIHQKLNYVSPKPDQMNGSLAGAIEAENGWISANQAFLINQIFISKTSDVVSNFINHPFSKNRQHNTKQLIDYFRNQFENFYPRFLHLFEMLFFPERFFMYPLFQHDVPLMLCAFDADYYLHSRQSLKSVVDKYIPGIFSSILTFQMGETNKNFAEVMNSKSKNKQAILVFIERLRHLIRLFCRKMEHAQNLNITISNPKKLVNEAASISVCLDSIMIKINNPWTIYEFTLPNGEEFLTKSPDGKHILEQYLQYYTQNFCRISENIEFTRQIERRKLSNAVAHGVKTSLTPLSFFSKDFKSKLETLENEINTIIEYRKYCPEMPLDQVPLNTTELQFDKLNSISKVLSFYSEDAERKVGILYGGIKKTKNLQKPDKFSESQETNFCNFLIAGLIRGYCIALIKGEKNIVKGTQVERVNFLINGARIEFNVPDVRRTLEFTDDYKFHPSGENTCEIEIENLRFGRIKNLDLIMTDKKLTTWKNNLLMIVIEELTLNALKSLNFEGDIVVSSTPECLFAIENVSGANIRKVADLSNDIAREEMGGLHTSYYIVEDQEYLGMKFSTYYEHMGQKFRNIVKING